MNKKQAQRHEQIMATDDALTITDLDQVSGGRPLVDPTWQQRQPRRSRRMLGIFQRRYEALGNLPADVGSDPTGG